MGFMANSPSVQDYGTNFVMKKSKVYIVEKGNVCKRNTGRCNHEPLEKLRELK